MKCLELIGVHYEFILFFNFDPKGRVLCTDQFSLLEIICRLRKFFFCASLLVKSGGGRKQSLLRVVAQANLDGRRVDASQAYRRGARAAGGALL